MPSLDITLFPNHSAFVSFMLKTVVVRKAGMRGKISSMCFILFWFLLSSGWYHFSSASYMQSVQMLISKCWLFSRVYKWIFRRSLQWTIPCFEPWLITSSFLHLCNKIFQLCFYLSNYQPSLCLDGLWGGSHFDCSCTHSISQPPL